MVFCVDSLDALRRGGRIGPAAARLGDLLGVKPLLRMDAAGEVAPLERVRTSARAAARMVELGRVFAGDEPVGVAVHHVGAPERAESLRTAVATLPTVTGDVVVAPLSAVVAAHTGLGTTGLVVHRGR